MIYHKMLTQIDKAHHHVGIAEKTTVLLGHHRGSRGRVRRFIRVHNSAASISVLQDGVIQIQHVHGSCGVSLEQERTGPVRQPEDGEDLPLHLSALLALQPPLDEAGLNVILQGEVSLHCVREHTATTRHYQS